MAASGYSGVSDVVDVLGGCLGHVCSQGTVESVIASCSSIGAVPLGPGLYAFVSRDPPLRVMYVGISTRLRDRIRTHCSAGISASEGVVRFLMHLLPSICTDDTVAVHDDAVERERRVKALLRDYIGQLDIAVAYCSGEVIGRRALRSAEDCARRMLNPVLNPPG